MVSSALAHETIGRQTYWFANGNNGRAAPQAYLLPTYDEYLIGYKDRNAAVDPEHAAQIIGGLVFDSTIVLNGRVVGTWRRTVEKRQVSVQTQFFGTLATTERDAVAVAAERYAAFLGARLVLA